MQYLVDKKLLSQNKILRRQMLDKYFPFDLVGYEECVGDHWKVTTFIPDDPEYYIDPQLDHTLTDWVDSVSMQNLASYKRFYKNCMFSFADSWSLYYWSLYLRFRQEYAGNASYLHLFHVDDHKDQDTPLIYTTCDAGNKREYRSLLSKNCIDLYAPDSIAKAICEKSITIGSFFAPLVHELDKIDILHWKPSATHRENSLLLPVFESDRLLMPDAQRPAIQQIDLFFQEDTSRRYFLSSSIEELLQKVQRKGDVVFLHVDCDAFYNRFNGSSQWTAVKPSIQLSMLQIKQEIRNLFSTLSSVFPKIYLNVALSPGFFPAEYWKDSLHTLLSLGEEYGIIQEDDFSNYARDLHPIETLYVLPT